MEYPSRKSCMKKKKKIIIRKKKKKKRKNNKKKKEKIIIRKKRKNNNKKKKEKKRKRKKKKKNILKGGSTWEVENQWVSRVRVGMDGVSALLERRRREQGKLSEDLYNSSHKEDHGGNVFLRMKNRMKMNIVGAKLTFNYHSN